MSEPQYVFEASSKPPLPLHEVPRVRATEQNLKGYGSFVDDPDNFDIEIVRGPRKAGVPLIRAPAMKLAGSRHISL